MDTWLLLCMGVVFFAVAEYAFILGMSMGRRDTTFREKEDKLDLSRKIDFWAMIIFSALYVLLVGIYLLCVFTLKHEVNSVYLGYWNRMDLQEEKLWLESKL